VSSARNLGLQKALGELIYFFDCDDIVATDILSFLVELQQTYQADIVSCSYLKVSEQSIPAAVKKTSETEKIVITSDKWQYSDVFMKVLMCKLFSRKVIDNICFSEQIYCTEDELFLTKVFINAKKLVYYPVIKAFYYIHEESLTRRVQTYRFWESGVLAQKNIKEKIYFNTDNIIVRRNAYNKYCTSIFELFRYVVLTGDSIHYGLLQQRYSKTLAEFLNEEKLPLARKMELKIYLGTYSEARHMYATKQ